jgi:choline dehydrogenase-like flavoprotein
MANIARKQKIFDAIVVGSGATGESLLRDRQGNAGCLGHPALRINMDYGENARKMAPDVSASAAEMLEAAGAEDIHTSHRFDHGPHEIGRGPNGTDPRWSVNAFLQTHDVKNLFVMDGGSFVSPSCHNPTLTMMALTCRACDHLVERFRRGDV